MNKPRFTPQMFAIAAVIVLGSFSVFGQATTASGQSYEVTLHVVIGSDGNSQRAELPKSLDGVAKQMRDNFHSKITIC